MGGFDSFNRLQVPHRRAVFALYGWKRPDGSRGGPNFKTAYSLSDAIDELIADGEVDDAVGYVVVEAFVEFGPVLERDPVLHVLLASAGELAESAPGV
jgi:hypothetical protein